MFCYKCGASLNEDARFCEKCGAAVANQPDNSNAAVDFAAAQPIYVNNARLRNRVIAAVVGISIIIIIIAVIAVGTSSSFSGLSGTWEAVYDYDGQYHTPYTIEFTANGTCIIYEYNRNPYSGTYTSN